MKSSNTRQPLHQQATPEQKGPFFSKANDDVKKKDDVFFQTKLAVGEKDDKHEKEADKVADKVQKKTEEKEKPEVQKKSKEEEKAPLAQAAAPAKDEDKKKVSKKEEEKKPEVQKMDKKEEEKPVQKMEKKEEEKPVQKMSAGDKKEEDKTKVHKKEDASKQEEQVQKKEAGSAHPAAHKVSIEERIKQSKGKGQSLPDEVRSFLEKELGADFTEVVIHTDGEAIAMNKELNALAFTNGFDIYFNAGQYKPDSKAGQKLLAHELTHVIQQTGVSKKKNKK